jgi:hypothetical protein
LAINLTGKKRSSAKKIFSLNLYATVFSHTNVKKT